MHIAVDISLYPLSSDYLPPIRDFIERIGAQPALKVECNALSTQVSGELEAVFAALRTEMARSFSRPERAVFVLKVVGGG
jgi:uncharacterized protein YqgV (UPF0045/DUF77 family)